MNQLLASKITVQLFNSSLRKAFTSDKGDVMLVLIKRKAPSKSAFDCF